jgi:hypothetical protein
MLLPVLLVVLLLAVLPGAAPAKPRLLVVGDSLAVDSEPYLRQDLPDWDVEVRAWYGFTLRQAMPFIDDDPRPPRIVVFNLFTNDSPRNVPALAATVVRTLRRHPGCHVWTTPYVRGRHGNVLAGAARRLRGLARRHPSRLVIADWAAHAARDPGLTGRDGVHDTSSGRRERARLQAAAARRCRRRLAREPAPQADAARREASSPSSSRSSP